MDDNRNPIEKQPGERPPGKYHYNPGNQSGKTADVVIKPESERDNSSEEVRAHRAQHDAKR